MLNRKPIEVRYLREEVDKSVIVPSIDKARECTERNGKKVDNFTLIPAYIKLYTEHHPVMCVAVFQRDSEYIMGYSICGKDDTFSYEIAKEVAADRAYSRLCDIKDNTQKILPTEADLKRVPAHLREEFVDICTEFFKMYGNLV